MGISENLLKINETIPQGVRLVAVSKTKSEESILEAYTHGQRCFGENKVQELVRKWDNLPKDIEWHYIGHLQTNKVKYIAPFVTMIHAIDSLKLLLSINKEAAKYNRKISCLLQFYIAKEDTKFGLDINEAIEILQSKEFKECKNISIKGVMGMATFTENSEQIRREFLSLKELFMKIKTQFFDNDSNFKEISMGMSDDYLIAIEEGSTLVRIGSSIFGIR